MRGSRPGERRGGRQKGTPNKKTAYMRAVMVALSAGPKVTPMDLMLCDGRSPCCLGHAREDGAQGAASPASQATCRGIAVSCWGSIVAYRKSLHGCAARR